MTYEYQFNLRGVSCGGCIRAIEARFAACGAIDWAQFDLQSKTLVVRTAVCSDAVIDLIRDAGYNATLEE
ncbi:heavy-metal-associated domain-containing protein [Marinobacterium rhizophilum]|uniref:Heavy-metal-associated domain-containing protein n=1 Tax=Marinobacterium rhizophilum TaxID=420402 RepID=A0ABY5HJ79_9GAMM|nr:heavy-metal-associated domain-containing protein [Marinobacterium rhizophilum]UTW12433.1 heavy-metal-associated domain-containing protein [Marinobacterium rhizophilum]